MQKRLKYEKVYNCDNIIKIDLHNGYSVIAIYAKNPSKDNYLVTMYLKENTTDTWKLIEEAENVEFNATYKTICSTILKEVSLCLEDNYFKRYIDRYEYESYCFDLGNSIVEKERLGGN